MTRSVDMNYGPLREVRDASGNVIGFEFSLTICNRTRNRIRLMVTENPWIGGYGPEYKLYRDDADVGADPDAKTAVQKAKENARFWTLWPKGDESGRDCRTIVWRFAQRLYAAYSDVYVIPDEQWTHPDSPDQFPDVYDAGRRWRFREVEVGGLLPHEPPPFLVAVIPVVRPMALDHLHRGKASIRIDAVEGVPPGFELVGTFPPIGQPLALEVGDRNSCGAVFLKQLRHAEMPEQFDVYVRQSIAEPREYAEWPATLTGFVLRVHPSSPSSAPRRSSMP